MKELQEPQEKQLEVGDILVEANIEQEYVIHKITGKGHGVFAIHNQKGEDKLYFRRALWRSNGVWRTSRKGENHNAFILKES